MSSDKCFTHIQDEEHSKDSFHLSLLTSDYSQTEHYKFYVSPTVCPNHLGERLL